MSMFALVNNSRRDRALYQVKLLLNYHNEYNAKKRTWHNPVINSADF